MHHQHNQSTVLATTVLATACLFAIACSNNSPLSSACDRYVACCAASQRATCESAAAQWRNAPNAETACGEAVRQLEAIGACNAPAGDPADASVSAHDAATPVEAGPVAVVGGYTLQAISAQRRSRTQRGILDVTLRLGVAAGAPSAPLMPTVFRLVGSDGLERIGTTGATGQCQGDALVAPGASTVCIIPFVIPSGIMGTRIAYLAPTTNTRAEAAMPAEMQLPPPPLRMSLATEGASCTATSCSACQSAAIALCLLDDPGDCAPLAEMADECTNATNCSSLYNFVSCMGSQERSTYLRCQNTPTPRCVSRTEDSLTACRDNVDNDGDSYIDCEDRGCCSFRDPRVDAQNACPSTTFCGRVPESTLSLCTDGVDNDLNSFVDCNDRQCCSVLTNNGRSSCPTTQYCGLAACPEASDFVVQYRSCPAGVRLPALRCYNAATTPEAEQACLATLSENCRSCAAYADWACATAGTTGPCNREWNCLQQCLTTQCPSGSGSCRQSALDNACAGILQQFETCNATARATGGACASAVNQCDVL